MPHAPRTTDYALRFTHYISRFTFYASRFTFYVSRLTSHGSRITPFVFPLFLFVIAISAPFVLIQPAYAFPQPVDANNIAYRVEITYGDKMKLLGYDLSSRQVLPGAALTLTLDWQALARMDADYSVGIHVIDAEGRVVAARDSYPGHGMLPTRLWFAGQTIRDPYWLPISVEAAPGVARIQVSLYTRENRNDLQAFDPQGQTITPVIGRMKIGTANPTTPRVQHSTDFIFGKQIALVGYTVNRAAGLSVTLYWKRIAPIADDYTVFVHVFDAAGNQITQQDQEPQAGKNPTSFWDDGEIVADVYDLPAGTAHQIRVGLYRADTGERLPVTDAKGNPVGDLITLPIESRQ